MDKVRSLLVFFYWVKQMFLDRDFYSFLSVPPLNQAGVSI